MGAATERTDCEFNERERMLSTHQMSQQQSNRFKQVTSTQ